MCEVSTELCGKYHYNLYAVSRVIFVEWRSRTCYGNLTLLEQSTVCNVSTKIFLMNIKMLFCELNFKLVKQLIQF